MMNTAEEVSVRLGQHEAVCAERYGGIINRLGQLERVLMVAAGGLIVGMAGLIVTLAIRA